MRICNPLERAQNPRNSVFSPVSKVRRCFYCISKALLLSPADLNVPRLIQLFPAINPSAPLHPGTSEVCIRGTDGMPNLCS